jgi:anti-sigma regulatory factor (Ser/Thr protein kinase)
MNVIAPARPAELYQCRVRLAAGPDAAAAARRRVREAIGAWDVPVDPDVAVLLASELVTNAIRYESGDTVTLAISSGRGQLRVDVHDSSCLLPVVVDTPADAETGRGLMLVATLATNWGFYLTPAGKAVFFTLTAGREGAGPPGHARGTLGPAGGLEPPARGFARDVGP